MLRYLHFLAKIAYFTICICTPERNGGNNVHKKLVVLRVKQHFMKSGYQIIYTKIGSHQAKMKFMKNVYCVSRILTCQQWLVPLLICKQKELNIKQKRLKINQPVWIYSLRSQIRHQLNLRNSTNHQHHLAKLWIFTF